MVDLAIALETCEVVIRVHNSRRFYSSRAGGRSSLTADQELEAALRRLRSQRYEVDLFIRGTWRRQGGYMKPVVLTEQRLERWFLRNGQVDSSSAEGGNWYPCPSRKPWPELVIRGVRS